MKTDFPFHTHLRLGTHTLPRSPLPPISGDPTFGKGVVQTVRPLGSVDQDLGGVKVTVARYLTPSGEDINGRGVVAGFKGGEGCDGLECLSSKAWEL